MKAPAFQMYTKDWLTNVKLRRCSPAARGAWIDVLCLMHGSEEYGVLRWPLKEIASVVNVPIKLLLELAERKVLKGADVSAPDLIHTPRHAGKDGEPITLLTAGSGPCWYCSRFLRDQWIRQRKGEGSRFSEDNQPPSRSPNPSPTRRDGERKGGATGERQGDGSAVASASAVTTTTSEAIASGGKPPDAQDLVWAMGVPLLTTANVSERNARSMLGAFVKTHGAPAVVDALQRCATEKPLSPVPWLQAALKPKGAGRQDLSRVNYSEGVTENGSI